MPVVDDHGRIFGRYNLLDLALATFLLGLIPLGYGAYLLFKDPVPTLTAVEPGTIQFERNMRVAVRGENLRPYMRISLNDLQTRTFLFQDPTRAEVTFAEEIPPGTYDVVLYDFAQERARLPKALTIAPPALPVTRVRAAGFLMGVKASQAALYKPGYDFPTAAKILASAPPAADFARVTSGAQAVDIPVETTVRVPVLLELYCSVEANSSGAGECRSTPGPAIGPGVYITLPSYEGRLPFLVIDVQPPVTPTSIEVKVRIPDQDAVSLATAGDLDLGAAQNPFAAGAKLLVAPTAASHSMTLTIPAFPSLTGWQYGGQTLRVGGGITFYTPRYILVGTVSSIPPLPTAAAKP